MEMVSKNAVNAQEQVLIMGSTNVNSVLVKVIFHAPLVKVQVR
jgi:hypothetical protein